MNFCRKKTGLARILLNVIMAAALSGVFITALPQDANAQAEKRKHEPDSEIKRSRDGSLFVLEDIEIEGKVYKPEAFHVISRKELSLEWDVEDPRFRRSFLDRVIASVESEAF